MFQDTKAGTTHYQNDCCGEPEHNDMTETQRADDIIGHNVSGLESVRLPNKEIEEIVETLMGALHLLNARSWSDNAIMHDMPQKEARDILRQALLSERQKAKEALKLWRPYFYRDKINEEDIKELDKLLDE